MRSGYLTPHPPSMYNSTQTPELDYEVLHYRNRGQNHISSTRIGTFTTLQDAQYAAQDTLRSALDGYLAKGWIGYYCNDIDLELRGLITGLVSEQAYECLSEVHISATARPYEPFQSQGQLASIREPRSHGSSHQHAHTHTARNETHTNTPTTVMRLPPHIPNQPPPTHDIHTWPHSFSQSRPL